MASPVGAAAPAAVAPTTPPLSSIPSPVSTATRRRTPAASNQSSNGDEGENAALLGKKSKSVRFSHAAASAPIASEAEEYELYLNKDAGLALHHRRTVPLDFASGFPARLSMPDVLQALVCDYLDRAALRNLQHCSRGAHFFVQRRHRRLSRFRNPKHLGRLTTFESLDAYQRLDLKLMRFYDRPLWQRILIGIGCVPLVPFVLAWHSPKAVRFLWRKAVVPGGRCIHRRILTPTSRGLAYAATNWVARPTVAAAKWTHRTFVRPVVQAVAWTARTAYRTVLVPAAKAVDYTARTAYRSLLVPAAKGADYTARSTYRNILTPIGHGFTWTVRATYAHVLSPIGRGGKHAAVALRERAVGTGRFVSQRILRPMARGFWEWLVVPAIERIVWFMKLQWRLLCWLDHQLTRCVLAPLVRALRFLWSRVFVPFVRLLWLWLIWPILRTCWHIIRFVSEDIIFKVAASLWAAARFLIVGLAFHTCIVPLGRLLMIPLNALLALAVLVGRTLADWTSAVAHTIADWTSAVAHTVGDWLSAVGLTVWAVLVAIGTPISELGSVIARALGG